ncbi:uncharacterized protein K452DRAFT_73577 [Aplosporella prunicola CBS 121167]|uniref:Uncharacterized protein n=1 Tax=Aplosporella prunicola CBS 121167 TaxID=1176127 RepID=A0A6A6B592_9PEZI|nr:uncharacterized protein K452DRAFT_73577 [Aplosporella prunicola CBS 121167]KAF2139210.1 hypothetical protein K452DRAFT_73577 [Aplosporella prunicola CBS 121167]
MGVISERVGRTCLTVTSLLVASRKPQSTKPQSHTYTQGLPLRIDSHQSASHSTNNPATKPPCTHAPTHLPMPTQPHGTRSTALLPPSLLTLILIPTHPTNRTHPRTQATVSPLHVAGAARALECVCVCVCKRSGSG